MRRDLACSLILFVVAVCYYIAASRIGHTALSDSVGAAGLPRVYAVALAIVAAGIGIAALLGRRLGAAAEPGAGASTREMPSPSRRLARGTGAASIGVATLALMPLIGYPFAIALMIAAMAVFQGERFSLRVLVVAAAGAAALFVLFDLVLGVTLPAPWND